jgi:hypothetical protein
MWSVHVLMIPAEGWGASAAQSKAVSVNDLAIAAFVKRAHFPISFLDYETYPMRNSTLPRLSAV